MVCFSYVAVCPYTARPTILKAELPMSPDRTILRTGGTSSSSRRRDLVFVVNPRGTAMRLRVGNHRIWSRMLEILFLFVSHSSKFLPRGEMMILTRIRCANGRTAKEWKKLLPFLRSRLDKDCNISESFTSGPSHAIDITREAIKDGADAVIAVGGDGTLHEVINGFFWDGKPLATLNKVATHSTALGLIPLGTGSDFARTFGWKNDPCEAIERIARGMRTWIDVGVIDKKGKDLHYFVNVADIHLSAKAGYYASKYKKFGNLCYVIGSLQAFMGHHNRDMRIRVNGGEWKTYPQVTALCIGNAKYFGGGMKITPNADPRNGNLEIVILQDFKWYDFVLKLYKLYNGTHLSVENVTSLSVQSIEVEEIKDSGSIYVQSDGEHLGFLPRKFCVMPGIIEMIC